MWKAGRLALAAFLTGACGSVVPLEVLPPGEYGGEHVSLSVSANSARVEFDCAHGEIPSTIRLDAEGRFSVDGTFTPERGGPATTLPEDVRAARYTGTLQGRVVTFTIDLIRERTTVGTFSVESGSPPQVTRCLLVGPGAQSTGLQALFATENQNSSYR